MEPVRSGRGWARTGVLGRLNAEWSWLAQDPAAEAACVAWSREAPVLSSATTPEEVLRRITSAPDVVLGALLAATAGGDTLAGRVVLQAMLGKTVRMAVCDRRGTIDDYVAALWCVIAAYPLAARPGRVAANLALETLKAVRRERYGSRDVALEPTAVVALVEDRGGTSGLDAWARDARGGESGAESLTAAGVIVSALQQRLLDPTTGALLHSVYADGLSGRAAAQRHQTSPGAVRVRCSRAVRVLSQHADRLVDAA